MSSSKGAWGRAPSEKLKVMLDSNLGLWSIFSEYDSISAVALLPTDRTSNQFCMNLTIIQMGSRGWGKPLCHLKATVMQNYKTHVIIKPLTFYLKILWIYLNSI